ncbi:hypothetical protein GDO78_010535 [Eleutherodactylus coqui]|uniref:Uncharacterized protein n=1 Tax=Eleutherodactylus coqui TaxID=57060 RepID=A0A8J6F6D1_ELECQ|nr:hypothetical protein GDO78_010535 [Eleutherodactylus coqui]
MARQKSAPWELLSCAWRRGKYTCTLCRGPVARIFLPIQNPLKFSRKILLICCILLKESVDPKRNKCKGKILF